MRMEGYGFCSCWFVEVFQTTDKNEKNKGEDRINVMYTHGAENHQTNKKSLTVKSNAEFNGWLHIALCSC